MAKSRWLIVLVGINPYHTIITHNEMIAVIAAHRDGKKIECGSAKDNVWGPWTAKAGHMNFQAFDYRIAVEPRRCWVKWDKDGELRYTKDPLLAINDTGLQLVVEEIK